MFLIILCTALIRLYNKHRNYYKIELIEFLICKTHICPFVKKTFYITKIVSQIGNLMNNFEQSKLSSQI